MYEFELVLASYVDHHRTRYCLLTDTLTVKRRGVVVKRESTVLLLATLASSHALPPLPESPLPANKLSGNRRYILAETVKA